MNYLKTAAAAGLAALLATPASALPLTGSFATAVYHGSGLRTTGNNAPGGLNGTATQALPSAIGALSLVANFTYTGPLAFALPGNGTNSIAAFFASAGGSTNGATLPTTVLSSGGFTDATLIKITFTTASAITGSITHDDGISLFAAGNTTTNLLPGFSAPTSAVSTPYSLAAGTYDLYYSEVNGLPATLNVDVATRAAVPEPVSLALLGAGLVGMGLAHRKTTRA